MFTFFKKSFTIYNSKKKKVIKMKILFVCTGNTCRSPMAQGLMNKKAEELKLCVTCESAGIGAFTGDCVSENSVKAMKKMGVDISSHRARCFSPYMAQEYDLFVAMTKEHGRVLSACVPSEKLRVFDIPDPYGKGEEEYEKCALEINGALEGLTEEQTEILPMTEEHISAVAEIERQCFSDPWSEEGLKAELTNENARFYVFTCFGSVLGYMGMHIVLDECYIANVAVSDLHRRRGIGERLVRYCVKQAEKENCSFISLEVRVSNGSAIALYEKAGFNAVGERKNFYSHPTENGLIMTKELR